MREGSDLTIVTYSRGVQYALEAAEQLQQQLGVSAEVINLRSLRPMDSATILKSVMKTCRCITVEFGWPFCGIGAEISAQIMESEAFGFLDGPVLRVTGVDVPMPYAKPLEAAALPQISDIVATAKKVLNVQQ